MQMLLTIPLTNIVGVDRRQLKVIEQTATTMTVKISPRAVGVLKSWANGNPDLGGVLVEWLRNKEKYSSKPYEHIPLPE